MERVHDVLDGQRVLCCKLDFAAVVGRAYEDEGVGLVPADDGDDDVCVFLDVFPGAVAIGLVADFEDDVRDVGVFLCHRVEEFDGFGEVLVGIVVLEDVPVDDDVHIVGDGVLDAFAENPEVLLTVAVHVVVRVHGEADEVGVPFATELLEQTVVDVLWVPGEAVRARALEDGEVPLGVAEDGSFDVELYVDGRAGDGCWRVCCVDGFTCVCGKRQTEKDYRKDTLCEFHILALRFCGMMQKLFIKICFFCGK